MGPQTLQKGTVTLIESCFERGEASKGKTADLPERWLLGGCTRSVEKIV